jgi:hypothetical protein
LDRLAAERRPRLIRGDAKFGNEPVMRAAEQRGQPYLFKLRLTKGVKRAIERAMGKQDWQNAGAGWHGKDGQLRLEGWSRHRRIVILRRRIERSLALTERDSEGQLRLGFAEIDDGREVWEYAVLSSPSSRASSFFRGWRSTPGTSAATSHFVAHLDHGDDRLILVLGGEGPVRFKVTMLLRHGELLR